MTTVFVVATLFILMLIPLIFCAPNIPINNQLAKRNKDSFDVQRRLMSHIMNMNEINNVLSNENFNLQNNSYENFEYNIIESGISKKIHGNTVRSERDANGPDTLISFDLKSETIPACNASKSFCENVIDYPENEIMEALNKTGDIFNGYFSTKNEIEVKQRSGYIGNIDICDIDEKKIFFPQKFRNKNGNWRYVVNLKDKIQGLPIERCSGIENPCTIQGYLANGYTSVCIQKYTMKSLVIYIPHEKKIEIQKFEIPSCCTCNLRYKFDPAM